MIHCDKSDMQTSAKNPANHAEKSAAKSATPARGSKDELRYWRNAIRLMPNSPYFYVEIQRDGDRRRISLETSNRAAAAARARQIWQEVRVLGWDGWMAKYRPERLPNHNPSVGEFLAEVE